LSTQEVRDIYKKVQIAKEQVSKKTREAINSTLESRLTRVFDEYWKLLQNPKISASDMDEAKRDMSKMLDIIQMDSDHDVIMALTNNEITRKYKENLR